MSGRVIDIDRRFGQPAGCHRQARKVPFRQIPGTNFGVVHASFRAQHPHHQLFFRHFERENPHCGLRLHGDVLGNVQDKGGFAHARAGRDNHQVRGLEPCRFLVKVQETGRNAGHQFLALVQLFDGLDRVHNHIPDLGKGRANPLLGHVKDQPFGFIQKPLHVFLAGIGPTDDFPGHVNQTAQDGLFLHDPRVEGNIGCARHLIAQFGQIGGSADLLQFVARFEGVGQRNQVNRLTPLGQGEHGQKNFPVGLAVKIIRAHDLNHPVEGVGVQQDTAQDGLFRLQALRRNLA